MVVAAAGWIAISAALAGRLEPVELLLEPLTARDAFVGAGLFLSVSAGARLLAFPLSGLVRGVPPSAALSLDAAILIAGALSVGTPIIAAGLALILTVDTLIRALRNPDTVDGQSRSNVLSILRRAFYTGGVSGGLLLVCASAFGTHLHDIDERMWMVQTFGLTFLAAHALLQVVHAGVCGHPLKPAMRRAVIALLAEATLLPIGAVIVHIWNPRQPLAFVLLGATYLLVSVGFYRLARITASLRGRVRELQTLTRSAQALATELEVPRLVATALREIHRALPAASLVEMRLRRAQPTQTSDGAPVEGADLIDRHALERGRQRVRQSTVPRVEWDDAAMLVLQDQLDAPAGAAQARMVAPLRMYGETLGVLVVESHHPSPFGVHDTRLVEGIAGQAASALEHARLNALANFDGLTGLYCRRYFDTRLLEEIERARRFDSSFCLVLLDIDNFKKLNDTRGHLAGDRALREVARLASAQLRNVDLAARYGGEELVFLLPRTSLTEAHVVAERIREAVGSHVLHDVGRVTVSIGVAAYADNGATTALNALDVLGRSDTALYRAKARGKDRVEVDLGVIELSPALAPINRRRA